ncbi:MAG: hypothetical protein AB7Q81_15450 [Gammaproteobacteria bacterium]
MNRLTPAATARLENPGARSAPPPPATPGTPDQGIVRRLFGEDGFTFGDLIDLVNPLQHIPVLGSYYRKWTGDAIAPALRIAGGALFGGPLGAGLAAAGLAVEAGIRGALDLPGPDGSAMTAIAAGDPVDETPADWRPDAAPTPPAARESPGGWLVAQARQVTPDLSATDGEAAVAAIAAPASPGGWLVAAGRAVMPEAVTGAAPPSSVAVHPGPGGWLVATARPWPPPGSVAAYHADDHGLAWRASAAVAGRHVDTRA